MDFRILGPLEVLDAGRTVRLGEGRQRALLALLLLRPNQVVSSDRLVEELWDEEPAPTAPKMLQIHISWAPTEEQAIENAMVEWPNGGMAFFPKQDIKNPEDFEGIAKLVRAEDFANRVMISSDLEAHCQQIQHYIDMGFDEIHLHNVGRNQTEFIEVFGKEVLPALKLG